MNAKCNIQLNKRCWLHHPSVQRAVLLAHRTPRGAFNESSAASSETGTLCLLLWRDAATTVRATRSICTPGASLCSEHSWSITKLEHHHSISKPRAFLVHPWSISKPIWSIPDPRESPKHLQSWSFLNPPSIPNLGASPAVGLQEGRYQKRETP